MTMIFVDCEATGACPAVGELTEFGAIEYETKATFHGRIWNAKPSPDNPALSVLTTRIDTMENVFIDFDNWIRVVTPRGERAVMVSDNPAFDFQWINDGFWRSLGRNPLGHSARRIGDFYAGVVNDITKTQPWKRWRRTPHDHNPVHDAMGNVEAFEVIMRIADTQHRAAEVREQADRLLR